MIQLDELFFPSAKVAIISDTSKNFRKKPPKKFGDSKNKS